MRPLVTGEFCLHPAVQEIRMQEVPSSHLPVITGICNPCKSQEWRHCSLKLELKLKYLKEAYYDFIKTKVGLGFLNVRNLMVISTKILLFFQYLIIIQLYYTQLINNFIVFNSSC